MKPKIRAPRRHLRELEPHELSGFQWRTAPQPRVPEEKYIIALRNLLKGNEPAAQVNVLHSFKGSIRHMAPYLSEILSNREVSPSAKVAAIAFLRARRGDPYAGHILDTGDPTINAAQTYFRHILEEKATDLVKGVIKGKPAGDLSKMLKSGVEKFDDPHEVITTAELAVPLARQYIRSSPKAGMSALPHFIEILTRAAGIAHDRRDAVLESHLLAKIRKLEELEKLNNHAKS